VTVRCLSSLAFATGFLAATLAPIAARSQEPERAIPPAALLSGRAFLSAATQAQQDDLTVNPGMLWVEEGDKLWHAPAGKKAISCATCHGEPARMKGVATRYPAYDPALNTLLNLEARIQRCRVQQQEASPLAYESQQLLALTALVALQSRGLPIGVIVDGPVRAFLDSGRSLYYQQQGQLNLSCAQGASACAPSPSARAIPTAFRPTAWNGRRWAPCIAACEPAFKACAPNPLPPAARNWSP
jgi:L-cysteine S-thiosulfotransferase